MLLLTQQHDVAKMVNHLNDSMTEIDSERWRSGEPIPPPFPKKATDVVCIESWVSADDKGESFKRCPENEGKTLAGLYPHCPRINNIEADVSPQPLWENDTDPLVFDCPEVIAQRNIELAKFDLFCRRLSEGQRERVRCVIGEINNYQKTQKFFAVPDPNGRGGVCCNLMVGVRF